MRGRLEGKQHGARSCRWETLPGLLGSGQSRAQRDRTKAGRNTRPAACSPSPTLPAVKSVPPGTWDKALSLPQFHHL